MSSIAPIASLPANVLIQGPIPMIAREEPMRDMMPHAYQLTNEVDSPEGLERFMEAHPGYNLNSGGRCCWTIMAVAIDKGFMPLIHALLDRDPSLVRKGREGTYPYMVSAGSSLEIARAFIQHGADINLPAPRRGRKEVGETALYVSSETRNSITTKFLLLNGAALYQAAREPALRIQHESDERDNIINQVAHIQEVIQEIKLDYTHSYRDFSSLLHAHSMVPYGPDAILVNLARNNSFFSRLPKDLGSLIMSYLPHTQNCYRFLVNSALIKPLSTPRAIESSEVAVTSVSSSSSSSSSSAKIASLDPFEQQERRQAAIERFIVARKAAQTASRPLETVEEEGGSSASSSSVSSVEDRREIRFQATMRRLQSSEKKEE